MSSNENSSHDSSSDSSTVDEFDEWGERVNQYNRHLDRILEDMAINLRTSQPTIHATRGRRRYIERQREEGHNNVFNQYFSETPTYPADIFRRRFRMQKHLFLRILEKITTHDEFFHRRRDATGRQGMSSLQKCNAAMRVLAYGKSPDAHDEYLRMSESSIRASLVHFVEGVIANFGDEYLRRPSEQDLARLLFVGEQRGFPGMMGSIDCMHWEWKNCPNAWVGQYTGRSGKPTIILEAVASYDLWIRHAFFGTPGSSNDINVLDQSPVFNDILEGRAPKINYTVNGQQKNMGYYLTDGIYPSWAAFFKTISSPQIQKHKLFAQHQEAARKDVERAFGVLQACFAFIKRPCLVWNRSFMGKIMIACIIMHNMIVEDERDTYLNYCDSSEFMEDIPTNQQRDGGNTVEEQEGGLHFEFSTDRITSLSRYMTNRSQLRDRQAHATLKHALIEHLWQNFGNGT